MVSLGWWNQTADGTSLVVEETGLVWGDGPADILDKALDEIRDMFVEVWGRRPTRIELTAGLLFSLADEDEVDGR